MNTDEKVLAGILFKIKILQSDGYKFEELFTQIMSAHSSDFEQIKPCGKIGDRKNDGFIRNKGIYYQVYAPEDIRSRYPNVIKKLNTDFSGLIEQWKPVNEFYFVVNDKYKGVNADASEAIEKLVKDYNLNDGKILTAKDLGHIALELSDEKIKDIVGFFPDTDLLSKLNYTILDQVIAHIMKLPIVQQTGEIKFPNWDRKIDFNKLSSQTKLYLNTAAQNLGSLNHFLDNQPFLAENLQERLIGMYQEIKAINTQNSTEYSGDYIFWDLVKKCSPKNELAFEAAVLTVLAKYFESCDIFEEPK